MELKKDEKVPEGIVIEKDGKRYRIKRYATKLKTYTPTMMKRKSRMISKNPARKTSSKKQSSSNSSSQPTTSRHNAPRHNASKTNTKKSSRRPSRTNSQKRNPNPISKQANDKINKLLKDPESKGRVSKPRDYNN
jgi:hypothetical protein